jgi:NADPH:quinone reductase-like Zn-dependent oxidoreductase
MQAVGLEKFGEPGVLRVLELPDPQAGPGEVRVRVHAAAINPADTLLRSGVQAGLLGQFPAPYVPGMDIAGVVDQVGDGTVTDLSVGDPVMAIVMPIGTAAGGYAEYKVLPASWVVRAPKNTDHTAAATLPMNALTALLTMDQLALPPGSVLAVTGAAGQLGSYLIQLAKHAGLTVIADAAPADEDLVRRTGADEIIARGTGLAARLLTRYPAGVDAITDAALAGPSLYHSVRDGGTFVRFRGSDEPGGYAPGGGGRITVRTTFVPDYFGRTDKLKQIRELTEAGVLVPRVAGTYSPAEAPDAHRRFEAGGVRGRLVITF